METTPATASEGAPETTAPPELIVRSFKASELPVSSSTRAAVDSLTHTFKKKGGYDAIRKKAWEEFENSVRNYFPMKHPMAFPMCNQRRT